MNSFNKARLSIYLQLMLRFLLSMLFLSISRVIFYLFNIEHFRTIAIADLLTILRGGIVFDTTASLYANVLVIVMMILPFKFRFNYIYQNITHFIFIICNSVCLVANAMDTVFYSFTMKRTTATIFNEFNNDDNILKVIWSGFFDYWQVSVVTICLLALFVFLAQKIKYSHNYISSKLLFYSSHLVLMVITGGLVVAGVRGGFAHSTRPITLSNASKYIKEPNQRAIVLNTPFAIIRTFDKKPLEKYHYFDNSESTSYFNTEHSACKGDSSITKPNVVVIILESFGRANIGHLNTDIEDYKGYTPFLDSLSQHCLSFKHAFANGRKSIDALPSIISGIPSIREPFILSSYSGNAINSIASLLNKQGYYSAFFHGAPNGSMGFDAFMNQCNFNDYFGKNEYNNNADYDGIWGIWDELFFQYFAKSMNNFEQPFVSSIFSLSSHHPFKVPTEYEGVFDAGTQPLHQCIGYTDNALRKFFDSCKKAPWFENTLFIITADHMSQHSVNKYHTGWGAFAVPIMLYMPNNDKLIGLNDSTIVQQADILPTVMNLIGSPTPFVSFGNDMLNPDGAHFAFLYKDDMFILIEDGYYLLFDGEKTIGLYHFFSDVYMKNNLIGTNLDIQNKLENRIKALAQQYSERLIDNNMVVKLH